jgi:hypothetical protein
VSMSGPSGVAGYLSVIFVACSIIALTVLGSPLIAVLVTIPFAFLGLLVMVAMRRRERTGSGDRLVGPETDSSDDRRRSRGEPASGEG